MKDNIKQVMSALVSDNKITLYTITGEVLDMKLDGPYDTTRLSEFLVPQITGTKAIEINLNDYLAVADALTSEYMEEGVEITHVIDGQEVQGIFYPQKMKVAVEHEGEKVVIPQVEKLTKHIKRASDEKSPSVRNFLRRLAPVVKERRHSAEDLMAFIERSDLPLTNDGRIIGYKRVRQGKDGNFVDCHTGNITQKVGDRVWMDISGVDADRNRSCSHGLHVANLGYLRGFSGSHTLIVLVEPENFIAVPHGETTKCRVCSYDIIGVMTSNSHNLIGEGHIEGDNSLERLISNAVDGKVVKLKRTVKVGERKVLEILPITEDLGTEDAPNAADIVESVVQSKSKTKPSGKSLNTDDPLAKDPERKAKDIKKMAKQTKAATTGTKPWDSAPAEVIAVFEDMRANVLSKSAVASKHNTSTRTMGRWSDKYDYDGYVASKAANMTVGERAMNLFNQWREAKTADALEALVAFKKARKKGWASLGFTATQEKQIVKAITA